MEMCDGWCGWCGEIFMGAPPEMTHCPSCGNSLKENPPNGPVEPNGSPLDHCISCGIGESQ